MCAQLLLLLALRKKRRRPEEGLSSARAPKAETPERSKATEKRWTWRGELFLPPPGQVRTNKACVHKQPKELRGLTFSNRGVGGKSKVLCR